MQDYETLVQQLPGDEEVGKALVEAQQQLKKLEGQDYRLANNFINVTSKDQFKQLITAPGEFLPSFKINFLPFLLVVSIYVD